MSEGMDQHETLAPQAPNLEAAASDHKVAQNFPGIAGAAGRIHRLAKRLQATGDIDHAAAASRGLSR